MSIIFEALKKIEEEKRENPLGGPPPVFAPPPADSASARHRPSAVAVLLTGAAGAAIAVVAAALLVRQGARSRTEKPAPAPPRPGLAAPAKPPLEEVRLKPRVIAPAVEGFSGETIQPAVPDAVPAQESQAPSLRLRGLSRSGTRSWAFINDRMLKVGDTVEGAEVVEILSDRVKLRSGGKVFTLTY